MNNMNPMNPIKYSILLILLFVSPGLSAMPNIVFILADDLTRFDIGAYGSKDSKTPIIDKLAADGMKFNKTYQAAPMCSPTRHNIHTGLYPTRSGAYPNHTFANNDVKSVAAYLKPLGYEVALSGKRHINPDAVFDYNYLNESGGPDFDKVDTFLQSAASNKTPFCLFVASKQPHLPWTLGDKSLFDASEITLPPHFVDNEKTRDNYVKYLAEINYLDGQVKETLDLLEKHNLTNNTVVVFASEQGSAFPFAKWTCYNAGLGSALIVKWPGVVAAGSVSDAIVEYSDFVPTFIDLAGGAPASGLDGKSIVPVLKGETQKHKKYSYGIMTLRGVHNASVYYPIRSINDGTYRLILNLAPEIEYRNQARMPGWKATAKTNAEAAKLIQRHKFRPALELYNDVTDPWNVTNLAEDPKHAELIKELRGELEKWMEYAGDEGMATELVAVERQSRTITNGDNVIVHMDGQKPVEIVNSASGIAYEIYKGDRDAFPDFSKLTPDSKGVLSDFTQTVSGTSNETYIVVLDGFIEATVDAYYTFFLQLPGLAVLSIDGKPVVETAKGNKDQRYGAIHLKKGLHAIEVVAITNSTEKLVVQYNRPGHKSFNIAIKDIPADILFNGDPIN